MAETEELLKMADSAATTEEAIIETLRRKGWCLCDTEQLKTLIMIHSALAEDVSNTRAIVDSIESELLKTDLRSIGAKFLPDSNPKPPSLSHFVGSKILQVSSVRDISVSSIESFTKSSGSKRVLRLGLTDGHNQITAIEYSHIPSIPDDIVPGTKVCLENKIPIRSGIMCLNPKTVTVLGGVVQSLYEEWQMNRKYSGASRSSKLRQDGDTDDPPPFEKFQVGRASRPLAKQEYPENSRPTAVEPSGKKPIGRHQAVVSREDSAMNDPKTASLEKANKEKPSSSNARPKEFAEAVPVQNQAAAQKLLQKMSQPNQDNRQFRGRKYNRGKGKEEEQQVFTLDEWEKQKAGAKLKPYVKNEPLDTSNDEDLARQLQSQLNMEDSYVPGPRETHTAGVQDIRMSMFNYERDDHEMEYGGRGRGRGRGQGRGRGRSRGRGRGQF